MTMTTNPSKYCAKEYHGERPCIDPLTMAELRLRCARNKAIIGATPAGLLYKVAQLCRLLF